MCNGYIYLWSPTSTLKTTEGACRDCLPKDLWNLNSVLNLNWSLNEMKVHLFSANLVQEVWRGLTEPPNPSPNTNSSWGGGDSHHKLSNKEAFIWMMFVHFWCLNPKLSIHLKRLRWTRLSRLNPDAFPTLRYLSPRGKDKCWSRPASLTP